MEIPNLPALRALRPALNKGRIVGQKRPLKAKHVWPIQVRLELAENYRDLALFNMAIDSKLRGCDLVKMKVVDAMASGQIKKRASVLQSKTQKPVRFEISEGTCGIGGSMINFELIVTPLPESNRLASESRSLRVMVQTWLPLSRQFGKSAILLRSMRQSMTHFPAVQSKFRQKMVY
ncbi:MAG: integrase [Pseudomonadota bacterium]